MQVRVVANDFVLPGKTARLAAWASEQGVRVEHVRVADADALAGLQDVDLLIVDTPRPSDRAEVRERIGTVLVDDAVPWILVGGGAPESGGLAPAQARTLTGYYAAGGAGNFRHLSQYLGALHRGESTAGIAPPQALPATGYYHPEAPRVFAETRDLRDWLANGPPDARPRVAAVIAPGMVASMQTAVLDALVGAAAGHGVVVFGVWFEAGDAQGLSASLEGLDVDAVVNLTHLQNGSARRVEFEALDVPVIQTLGGRDGGIDAWREAAGGVAGTMVGTFLAVPESWGMSDPMVLSAVEDGDRVPVPEQVEGLAARLGRLAALRRTPAAQKRIALMFWNYPRGEHNLSASHLNVPRSLETISQRLDEAGYAVTPTTEQAFIDAGQAMLGGYYHPQRLAQLHAQGLADRFPVARYRAWLETLPERRRDEIRAAWGDPADHPAVRRIDGEAVFLIPRLEVGNLLVLPQPPRTGIVGESIHDLGSVPSHYYMAVYLYLREQARADALIHLGTHGTQEWTPGKDRGLWVHDWPFLAVGDLPVFYPYIQDNIGEAVQAKRRGRAVVVSHQAPAFAPSGLYDELRELYELVEQYWLLDAGSVRERTFARIAGDAADAGIVADMGWDGQAIQGDADGFVQELHDHLQHLAMSATPLGLHSFGHPPDRDARVGTVMQQLGEPYYRALGVDPDRVFAVDYQTLRQSRPYRFLQQHLHEWADPAAIDDPALRAQIERGIELERALADTQEIESLLRGLAGGFVPPGAGGDRLRNPELRSGRNLYPFEPERIPSRAAYAAGGQTLQQLLADYGRRHDGRSPEKLAFSLWSSSAISHLGVVEAQVLHALGLRPVWDAGERVTALEIIPAAELSQPRIDVVVQVTSVYRDQFDPFMRLLADAIDRLADIDGPGNPVARNREALAVRLVAQGVEPRRAQQLAALRIFSNAPGEYGSGLPDAVLDDAQADKDDASLAGRFLERLQFAYGADDWGRSLDGANLFAEQLRGVQAAVFARASNTHGMLSTDHPFEYLGGLSQAVRHLDGESPELYVADLRGTRERVVQASRFIADELRTRYLNPQWIGAMQDEGYAGTLQVLDAVDNLFGWQVTDPAMIRDDQWQAVHDTYVRDSRRLGIDDWFERHNPGAQAQLIERMQEAVARGHWQADAATLAELRQRLESLRASASTAGAAVSAGFGLSAAAAPSAVAAAEPAASAAAAEPQPSTAEPASPPPQVRGRVLQQVASEPEPERLSMRWWLLWLLGCLSVGALWQSRSQCRHCAT